MATLPSKFPYTVKRGSASVTIYRIEHTTTVSGFIYGVAWNPGTGRKQRQFADLSEAWDHARELADGLAQGRAHLTDVTASDAQMLAEALRLVGDVPLLSALEEWRAARELTAGALMPAAEAWARSHSAHRGHIRLADAVDRFIASKEASGHEGERTYRSKLKPLIAHFGPDRQLGRIAVSELDAYLQKYTDAVTRNDFRKRAAALWNWAKNQGLLPEGKSAVERTQRAREEAREIGILTPETFERLLAWTAQEQPMLLAGLVLAGFCGIRADEIHGKRSDRSKRQLWEDIDLAAGSVRVTVAKRNTPAWRNVPLCNAAREWLRLCPKQTGEVCPAGGMERLRLLARASGFELPENGLRHSFISFRVALTANKPQVALEAGNSVKEIDRRYRVPVTENEARRWFSIRPAS